MKKEDYVIGIDFGTCSVRTIIVDASSGEEKASSEFLYPRWKEGQFCDPSQNQFRQHPLDYMEGLEQTIREALDQTTAEVSENIRSISVATTGSTPVAVDEKGIPLALHPQFKDNPNAMFFLWKDHTAVKEAAEINEHAKKFDIDYLKYVGGTYSSEWFWAKLLYVLRKDEKIRKTAYSWVEHCDWISFLLTGGNKVSDIKHSKCTAGHKALWSEDFGGLPPEEFFASLDPLLGGFRSKIYKTVHTSDTAVGKLSQEWSHILGLPKDVWVGVGAMDAHMSAVGGQIEPYHLSKVMGTSTCDMMVAPSSLMEGVLVKGICGQVQGSIIPGMVGMEAGQSAFGDIYSWFKEVVSWPIEKFLTKTTFIDAEIANELLVKMKENILVELTKEAARLPLNENAELALDWMNGRRTPDSNQQLKGAIQGLNLGSDAPRIFRSLVEATCFGSRSIIERFEDEGIAVKGIIAVGGVAKKSPFIVQMMADVLGMPIKVHRSEKTCALGAAMFAATVAGIYPKVEDAMEAMGTGFEKEFYPDMEKHKIFSIRYAKYRELCDFIDK